MAGSGMRAHVLTTHLHTLTQAAVAHSPRALDVPRNVFSTLTASSGGAAATANNNNNPFSYSHSGGGAFSSGHLQAPHPSSSILSPRTAPPPNTQPLLSPRTGAGVAGLPFGPSSTLLSSNSTTTTSSPRCPQNGALHPALFLGAPSLSTAATHPSSSALHAHNSADSPLRLQHNIPVPHPLSSTPSHHEPTLPDQQQHTSLQGQGARPHRLATHTIPAPSAAASLLNHALTPPYAFAASVGTVGASSAAGVPSCHAIRAAHHPAQAGCPSSGGL
eukprot:scaffold34840_cov15-Tisochrysis_lutea.AAC.1